MTKNKSYQELELELLKTQEELATIKASCGKEKKISKLLEERERYLAMLENVTDVIGIIDTKGIIQYKSPNIQQIFGWDRDELIGKSSISNLHPDDQERITLDFKTLLDGEKNEFTTELRYLKKDGTYSWVEFSAVNKTETPHIYGILINYHDISDRIEANKALKESEARYRMLFTNMDDSSSLYEVVQNEQGEPVDYRFIAVNPVFEESIGYTNDFLKGKTLLGVFPKTEQIWLDAFRKAHKTGKAQKVIDYTEVLDMYFEIIAFIPQEGLLSMIGVDITERKKNEIRELESQRLLKEQNEEYLSINEELSERNEEYSILNDQYKAQNEALYKAMEKAKESDMLKSTFLQIMSHEIRTPMNAIYGFSELLVESENNTEVIEEYSRIIKNSSEQLLSVVNNVLTISSLETKQEEVIVKSININTLLEELTQIFAVDINQSGITITLTKGLKEEDAIINTDRTKLTQVISNLISNAIKFSCKGKIEVSYIHKNDFLEFCVSDTGIGMTKEEQSIIFEQFRQANHNIQKIYGGTGLGLTISKAFVELLGGKIWVESEIGAGTQFFFTLPFNKL